MSLTEQERVALETEYGRRKIRHIETVHYDEMYQANYERMRRLAERKCINPYTAIAVLIMTVCISSAIVIYVAAMTIDTTNKAIQDPQGEDYWVQTTNYFWDGNYFLWLIIPGSLLYVLRKVRINVMWD